MNQLSASTLAQREKRDVKGWMLKHIVWILLIGSILIMGAIKPAFFSVNIMMNILMQTATLGILTAGEAQALLLGEIDLSIVGNMAFSAGLGTTLIMMGCPWVLAVLFMVGFGTLIGFVNGILITKLRATALIQTLAMGMVLEGALMALTSGVTIIGFPDGFNWLGKTYIGGVFPALAIPFIVLFVVIWFIWNKTTFGRSLYAVGGNANCARVSGINVDKVKIKGFMLSGLCAGLAGYVLSSYLASVPMTFGKGYDMNALAAAVIGGVSLRGGIASVSGVIGGVLLITVIKVGIVILGVNAYFTDLAAGLMIFAAVIFDAIRTRGTR